MRHTRTWTTDVLSLLVLSRNTPNRKTRKEQVMSSVIVSSCGASSSLTVLWSWLVFCLETQRVLVVSSSFFKRKHSFRNKTFEVFQNRNQHKPIVSPSLYQFGVFAMGRYASFYRWNCSFTPNVFAHSSTFSWVPCLKTEAWSTAPVQFFLLVEYNKGKTCYRNLVYRQSNLS